jgi:hypothetical protein
MIIFSRVLISELLHAQVDAPLLKRSGASPANPTALVSDLTVGPDDVRSKGLRRSLLSLPKTGRIRTQPDTSTGWMSAGNAVTTRQHQVSAQRFQGLSLLALQLFRDGGDTGALCLHRVIA